MAILSMMIRKSLISLMWIKAFKIWRGRTKVKVNPIIRKINPTIRMMTPKMIIPIQTPNNKTNRTKRSNMTLTAMPTIKILTRRNSPKVNQKYLKSQPNHPEASNLLKLHCRPVKKHMLLNKLIKNHRNQ